MPFDGTPRRVVAIANGTYAALRPLDRAVPDAEELARLLEDQHGFEAVVVASAPRGALVDAIDDHLRVDGLRGGTLLVLWIGHARPGPDDALQLLGYRTLANAGIEDVELAEARKLGAWAAGTGARQVFVVLDTCHAGGGLVDAAALAFAVNAGRTEPGKAGFCVLAACLGDEQARSGALVQALIRLLRDGPRQPNFRWNRTRPYLHAYDLARTLADEWDDPRQQPIPLDGGASWDFVPNPFHQPGVPDQPVEHLLRAARGSSGEQSYFTGREGALAEIVTWMQAGTPGVFVVTGPAGCGKSAVAGRIVSLSSTTERARLLAANGGEVVPPELDPGAGSVDAQLQARGATVDVAAEDVARQLGLEPGAGRYGVLAEARRRRQAGDPLVVVVDGLDEARTFSSAIAAEFLAPLAADALVLVATRDVPAGDTTLIRQLGAGARVLDLGQDAEGTRRDVRRYVRRRMAGVSSAMDAALVAEELASADGAREAPFLLARLVTSQLRDAPVDTATDGWRLRLATTVESALERDLQAVVLEVDGRPHATAARELLRALVTAHGGGYPADDVWPAVASALSPTGTAYTRDHAFAVLEALARHVVAATEGEQPVYRVAHQRLADYLRRDAATAATAATPSAAAPSPDASPNVAARVGAAVLGTYERLLDAGLDPRAHAYLWRYCWLHLAKAGADGLAGLHRLVERDRAAFLPDLAAALDFLTAQATTAGALDEAARHGEAAVQAWRDVGTPLPLVKALFQLAFVRLAAGDTGAAEAAAREASALARAEADSPERSRALGSALAAFAYTQLSQGRLTAARLSVDEAITLHDTPALVAEPDGWRGVVFARNVAARVATAQGDLAAAAAHGERALALVDAHADPGDDPMARVEVLAQLAAVQHFQGATAQPDTAGRYAPTATPAADRLRREAGGFGVRTPLLDIETARGLLLLVLTRLLDLGRGVAISDPEQLGPTLDQAVALAQSAAATMPGAAAVLSSALRTRAALRQQVDPAGAAADRAEAQGVLRRLVGVSPLVQAELGAALDADTEALLSVLAEGGAMDDWSGHIVRQQEAVALLRLGFSAGDRLRLAGALGRLATLLELKGDALPSVGARGDAIQTLRRLGDAGPEARALLLSLLVDQSAALAPGRTMEAADLGREALALAQGLPFDAVRLLRGVAALNLAGVEINLAEDADAVAAAGTRALLQQAIADVEPFADTPMRRAVLVGAHTNLATVAYAAGDAAEALARATEAVTLLEGWTGALANPVTRALALLALGRAQRATGADEAGRATLDGVLAWLRGEVLRGRLPVDYLAMALNTGAPELWDELLDTLGEAPDVRRRLALMRWRSREQAGELVAAFLAALDAVPAGELRAVRELARAQRARLPEAFDAAWAAAAGARPAWLTLDPAHEAAVLAWWNTPTWALSRDYLRAHPALLDEATDVVLDELAHDDEATRALCERHRTLLARARTLGADLAYAPLLARVAVSAWIASDEPQEHLAAHPDLLQPEFAAALTEDVRAGDAAAAQFLAVLTLAQRGEWQLAFQAHRQPETVHDHLRAAWRSPDAARLAALAILVRGASADPSLRAQATAAHAVALALGGASQSTALELAQVLADATPEERRAVVVTLDDAMAHHAADRDALAPLVQAAFAR